MIDDGDAEFHAVRPGEPTWAETNFFGFYQADDHLNVGVYALFRPNLGIVSSTIAINSRRAVTPWDAEFNDFRASMPMPEPATLLNFELANSLKITCIKPNMAWDIGYDDGEGTRIAVRYESLMPPFDIHDPTMDPMAASNTDEGKFSWGTSYNGHFDQTGRYTGSVVVRGLAHEIDCVSTMDHSWGPRPERGNPNMSWLHAHFESPSGGDPFALHGIFGFDPTTNGAELWLTHGYILDGGTVSGLKAGRGTVDRRQERYAEHIELVVVDNHDRVHELAGTALTTYPWLCWPNMVSFNVLGRWEYQGREGFGEIQDFFELPQLSALNSDSATARPSLRVEERA